MPLTLPAAWQHINEARGVGAGLKGATSVHLQCGVCQNMKASQHTAHVGVMNDPKATHPERLAEAPNGL